MNHLLIAPIVVPLLAAVMCMASQAASVQFQRSIALGAVIIQVVVAGLLLVSASNEISVYAIGSWRAPFGIVMVLDRLSAIMLMLTAMLALPVLLYAVSGMDQKGRLFHPLFQLQLAGINGAFLTGDLFNLFVFFEMLLLASYGLLAQGGGLLRVRAGMIYVVLNVIGSSLFLIALALIYGTIGTLNMADIAFVLPSIPQADEAIVRSAMALLIVVFALKSALIPLAFWLPHTYGNAIAPVAALFAILTKVGIYALLRTTSLIFTSASFMADILQPWLVPVAVLTIAMGTIGALASQRLAVVAAYLVMVSTGTLLAVIGLPSVAGNSAAIYYMIHSTLVTAGLFLLADAIGRQRGEHGDCLERGPRMRDMRAFGGAFLILAVGVSGMPPLSGFFGKLMLMQAVQSTEWNVAIWIAVLASSLVVGLLLGRAASVIFWEPKPDEQQPILPPPNPWRRTALAMIVAASPGLTVVSAPVSQYAQAAADQLAVRQAYIDAVLGVEPEIGRERKPR